jgi:hypothetical protein
VTVIKGYTYVFSIAARNIVGQGPFWPSCLPSDSNCNVQGSPACFDPVTTKPVQIQNFGVLGPNRPNAFPMGTSQLRVQWGVNGQIPDPYYDYTDRLVNGGRNVIKVEVQRTEAGLVNQVRYTTLLVTSSAVYTYIHTSSAVCIYIYMYYMFVLACVRACRHGLVVSRRFDGLDIMCDMYSRGVQLTHF